MYPEVSAKTRSKAFGKRQYITLGYAYMHTTFAMACMAGHNVRNGLFTSGDQPQVNKPLFSISNPLSDITRDTSI